MRNAEYLTPSNYSELTPWRASPFRILNLKKVGDLELRFWMTKPGNRAKTTNNTETPTKGYSCLRPVFDLAG